MLHTAFASLSLMETSLLLGVAIGMVMVAYSRTHGPLSLKDLPPLDPPPPEETQNEPSDVLARGRCVCNAVDALVLLCIGFVIAGVAWRKDFNGSIEHILQLVEHYLPKEAAFIRKLML